MILKHLFFSCLVLTGLLSISSCREQVIVGSGPSKTEQRTVSGSFDQVEVTAPVNVEIRVSPGAAAAVQIDGYGNVLKYIKMEVKGNTLHIYVPDDVEVHTEQNAVAHITLPALSGVSISGSADASILGDVTGNSLSVEISGSGDAKVQSVTVSDLKVDLSGSASFSAASGSVNKATYDISGSGEVKAFGLQTNETAIDVAGSGNAQVTANKSLNTDISGSGHVSYKGHPSITKDISGVGSIDDAN